MKTVRKTGRQQTDPSEAAPGFCVLLLLLPLGAGKQLPPPTAICVVLPEEKQIGVLHAHLCARTSTHTCASEALELFFGFCKKLKCFFPRKRELRKSVAG